MKNAIFTCSDSKFGDFTINHWLKSLKDNVDLSNIDVIILDYGFTKDQISKLKEIGVIVVKCLRDGHVTSIRFRDIAKFLEKKQYDQVLLSDGGDIIFQDDLTNLFNDNKKEFRAVCEDYCAVDLRDLFIKGYFKKEDVEEIKRSLKGKRVINAGILVGPYDKFLKLCKDCYDLLARKDSFGPDQVAITYLLYKISFKELDEKYNYVILCAKNKFFIKDSTFYLENGEKIPIVHNAGRFSAFRGIRNFGYGKDCNLTKKHYLNGVKLTYNVKKKMGITWNK